MRKKGGVGSNEGKHCTTSTGIRSPTRKSIQPRNDSLLTYQAKTSPFWICMTSHIPIITVTTTTIIVIIVIIVIINWLINPNQVTRVSSYHSTRVRERGQKR